MNKYILPTILILASGGLLYFYIKNKGDKDNTTEENNNDSSTQSTPKQSTPKQSTPKQSTPKTIEWNNNKILKLGSKGIEVRMLQLFLNLALRKAGKTALETKSGVFGKKTEEALYWLLKVKQITIGQIKTAYIKSGKDWDYLKTQAAIQLTK
jgi:hypothetical protein